MKRIIIRRKSAHPAVAACAAYALALSAVLLFFTSCTDNNAAGADSTSTTKPAVTSPVTMPPLTTPPVTTNVPSTTVKPLDPDAGTVRPTEKPGTQAPATTNGPETTKPGSRHYSNK